MKKILGVLLIASVVFYMSCKKDKVATPTACFTVQALDSAKVATLDSLRIDSIIKVQAPGYLVDVPEGTAATAYKRTLIFRNCGSASDYKVIYTGDSTRIFVDPTKPTTITAAQTGADFSSGLLIYRYKTPGTFAVNVLSTNVGDEGNTISRSKATKTIILN